MHIHILGIAGTFMAGIALLAKQTGHRVTGSDQNIYPPMSTQLAAQGIELQLGYDPVHLTPKPDVVIIGNALSRGNPEVEAVLNYQLPYVSGPQWLYENILQTRWVLAIAGTHGKTTTSAMLAWILESAGLKPGFLIGGLPNNFESSARLGEPPYFVVEADEYDTAFFDKRSKFVHYRPRTAVLNNLEYDHADIFPDIAAIRQQFHHFIRTIPENGLIIRPSHDPNLDKVIDQGCWTTIQTTSISKTAPKARILDWTALMRSEDGSLFDVFHGNEQLGSIHWDLSGRHNVNNALSAIAAANHLGAAPEISLNALATFKAVKRRMEVRCAVRGITVYDDFAHHPTAIATTLDGLRARVGNQRIIAIVELRSNTMRLGIHADQIPDSLKQADISIIHVPRSPDRVIPEVLTRSPNIRLIQTIDEILSTLVSELKPGDHVLIMSNGAFDGIHGKIENLLRNS